MILHSDKKKVDTNMTGAGSFSIKASAKAFKILSDGLYSDKIRAVVRELSCNAVDSHTAAGCPDKPITVHLPNEFEQWFSVKDEGLGLSVHGVMNLYTTYFESTKTESNDQIGALGLGSKSPFSYTDSFSVISTYNKPKTIRRYVLVNEDEVEQGMEPRYTLSEEVDSFDDYESLSFNEYEVEEYHDDIKLQSTYTAYIGTNGEPAIQPLASVETNDHNGVEVRFPTKREDTREFRDRAQKLFRPFKVKPIVVGNSQYEVAKRGDIQFEGETWRIYEYGYWNKERIAIQGNIEYPLDISVLGSLTQEQEFVLTQCIDIEFDLGKLDISASRESLGYDETTINNIKEKADEIYKEIVDSINEKAASAKTLYEAVITAKKIKKVFNHEHMIESGLQWNGKDIPNYFDIKDKCSVVTYTPTRNSQRVKRNENSSSFTPVSSQKIILNDDKARTKGVTKCRNYAYENDIDVVMVQDKTHLKYLGKPDYLKTSDLDDYLPPKTARGKTAGKHFKYYSHYSSYRWRFDSTFETYDEVVGERDEVYFVPVSGKTECTRTSIYTLVEVAKYLGIIKENRDVIGVKEAFTKTKKYETMLEEGECSFIPLEKAVEDMVESLKGNYMIQNIAEHIAIYHDVEENIDSKTRSLIESLKNNTSNINNKESVMYKMIDEINNVQDYARAPEMNSHVMGYILDSLETDDAEQVSIDDTIYETYPMLDLVESYKLERNPEMVVQYINMMDNC